MTSLPLLAVSAASLLVLSSSGPPAGQGSSPPPPPEAQGLPVYSDLQSQDKARVLGTTSVTEAAQTDPARVYAWMESQVTPILSSLSESVPYGDRALLRWLHGYEQIAEGIRKGMPVDEAAAAWVDHYKALLGPMGSAKLSKSLRAQVNRALVSVEQKMTDIQAIAQEAEKTDPRWRSFAFAAEQLAEKLREAKERFGHQRGTMEWEEYIVSGHRAPHLALGQYRRMGGRVFGAMDAYGGLLSDNDWGTQLVDYDRLYRGYRPKEEDYRVAHLTDQDPVDMHYAHEMLEEKISKDAATRGISRKELRKEFLIRRKTELGRRTGPSFTPGTPDF